MSNALIDSKAPQSRFQTLPQLREGLVATYFNPPPSTRALSSWFKREGVAHTKSNPKARRGGGQVYFSVAHVERVLRTRTGGAR